MQTLQHWASHWTRRTSSHRLVVETIHLKLLHAQQRQAAPETGMLPRIIFIRYPTKQNLVNRRTPYYCRGTALSSDRAVLILPVLRWPQIKNVYHVPGQRLACSRLGLASTEQFLHAINYFAKKYAASHNFSCYPFWAVFLPINFIFLWTFWAVPS